MQANLLHPAWRTPSCRSPTEGEGKVVAARKSTTTASTDTLLAGSGSRKTNHAPNLKQKS